MPDVYIGDYRVTGPYDDGGWLIEDTSLDESIVLRPDELGAILDHIEQERARDAR